MNVARCGAANCGLADKRSVNATINRGSIVVAGVNGTVGCVNTSVKEVRACSVRAVARINRALDSIVTVHRDNVSKTSGGVTKGGMTCVYLFKGKRCVRAFSCAIGYIACVVCARVLVIAVYGIHGAFQSYRVTSDGVAKVDCGTKGCVGARVVVAS